MILGSGVGSKSRHSSLTFVSLSACNHTQDWLDSVSDDLYVASDRWGACPPMICWDFSVLLHSCCLTVWMQDSDIRPAPWCSLTLFSELRVKSSTPDPIYLISRSPNITSSTWGFLLPLRETSFICKLFAVANRYCSMAFQLNKISSYCVIHWAPDVTPIGK